MGQMEDSRKIENERQNEALRAKEEIELLNAANSRSLESHQNMIAERFNAIEGDLKNLENSSTEAYKDLSNGFGDKLQTFVNTLSSKINDNSSMIKKNQQLLEKVLAVEGDF